MQAVEMTNKNRPNVKSGSGLPNGIDVVALGEAINGIRGDRALGQTSWAIRSVWQGGTRSDHHVEGFTIGGQFVARPFTIRIDEPHELTGTNQYANPQEYLLSAMNACMMVGYAAVAALMGIELDSLEVRTSGDIDLRGFLGIDAEVAPGYESLEQTVHIASDASPEKLRELHEIVKRTSPNFFNITRAVPVHSKLVIED